MPVRDALKSKISGTHHLGYYWGYSSPVLRLAFFEYPKGRSRAGPSMVFDGYQGILQTDAYFVYDSFGKINGMEHFNGNAHGRRKFEAMNSTASEVDRSRVNPVLSLYRKVYVVERTLREEGAAFPERKQRRQQTSAPIMKELETFLQAHAQVGLAKTENANL